MNSPQTRLWALLCLAGFGWAACSSAPQAPEPAPRQSAVLRGASIELRRSPELDRVAELEEQRSTDDGRLLTLASRGNPVVRRRAITALGRLPFPEFGQEITEVLCRGLADPEVQILAAHALGLRQDPAAAGVLQNYFNDANPRLRAACIAAASRFSDPALHLEVMIALRDADLSVRLEAALGTALWDTSEARAADIDRALVDTLRPYQVLRGYTQRSAVEAELIWRTLYALGRRKSELGRGPFVQYSDSDLPLERLFALRGLGSLPPDQASIDAAQRALVGSTKSDDWRVAHAACQALGSFGDPRSMPGLVAASAHPSYHVRAEALRGLARTVDAKSTRQALALIKAGLVDVSMTVRAAALGASVQVVGESESLRRVERELVHEDPIVRLGAVDALALMRSGIQIEPLKRMAADPDLQVAGRALQGLGGLRDPKLRPFLQERLSHPDTGLRLAALEALAGYPEASDVPFLIQAFDGPRDDVSDELAYRVLECLGALAAAPGSQEFVQRALVDQRPFLRETARRVLLDDFGLEMGVTHVPPRELRKAPPLAGQDFPQWSHNPIVEVLTTRGSMSFELFPAEAPGHVVNFIQLAEAKTYDGLPFHRVVSNFVVQGGDYRGDGNGARSWRGGSLRHEISARKYTTGSLGMPRNANLDSGGGQFFVTHLPTPHLDGRYTIFGELRTGRSVLDALEIGDRILEVRVLPN